MINDRYILSEAHNSNITASEITTELSLIERAIIYFYVAYKVLFTSQEWQVMRHCESLMLYLGEYNVDKICT
jgi:hypothetical protein